MLARVVNDTNDFQYRIIDNPYISFYTIPYSCEAVICCIDRMQTGLQAFTLVFTHSFTSTYIEFNGTRGTAIVTFAENSTTLNIPSPARIRSIIAFPS